MLKNIFKSKRGDSTIYELLISLALLTFVVMFPIAVFSYMRTEININDVVNLSMQSLQKSGQLTPQTLEVMNQNLKDKNLPTFEDGTYIITNLEVTTLSPNIQVVSNNYSYVKTIDTNKVGYFGDTYANADTYVKVYRNAYIFKCDWNAYTKEVMYDTRCINMQCPRYDKIQYYSNTDVFQCKKCGRTDTLMTNNEANVVFLTVVVPITEKAEFLNRTMKLISFGTSNDVTNSEHIFKGEDGNYYFVKQLYGVAETYYNSTTGVQ